MALSALGVDDPALETLIRKLRALHLLSRADTTAIAVIVEDVLARRIQHAEDAARLLPLVTQFDGHCWLVGAAVLAGYAC